MMNTLYPIIAIAGYPGAGKTTLAGRFEKLGYRITSGSGQLRLLAKEEGYIADSNRDGLMPLWHKKAKIAGRDWLAKGVIEMAKETPVVFDGLRILEDANTLRLAGSSLIYLHPKPEDVLRRIQERARLDDLGVDSVEDVVARQDIEDSGDLFNTAAIRGLCRLSVLPIPHIDSNLSREQSIDGIVESILI